MVANHPGNKLVALTCCMHIRILCQTAGKMCGTLDQPTAQVPEVSRPVSQENHHNDGHNHCHLYHH